MLFEGVSLERLIVFAMTQIWPIIYSPYFARKLLKRAVNRSTITLSIFFINYALVFIIALVSLLFIDTPFSIILYSISLYLFMFNQGLLILTSWFMTRLTKKTNITSIFLIIALYLLIASYVFWIGFLYEGIIYNSSTGWRPIFTWFFFWNAFFYVTFALILPELFLATKIMGEFKGSQIQSRVKMFILGGLLNFFNLYFLILYNSWPENLIYRIMIPFIALILNIVSAYLAYHGIGRALE